MLCTSEQASRQSEKYGLSCFGHVERERLAHFARRDRAEVTRKLHVYRLRVLEEEDGSWLASSTVEGFSYDNNRIEVAFTHVDLE